MGETVDVTVGGWKSVEGLPLTKALVVDEGGAGALLRSAAGSGQLQLVSALLDQGISCLVADAKANTALHLAALGGFASVCRRLVEARADPLVRNTQASDD